MEHQECGIIILGLGPAELVEILPDRRANLLPVVFQPGLDAGNQLLKGIAIVCRIGLFQDSVGEEDEAVIVLEGEIFHPRGNVRQDAQGHIPVGSVDFE